MFVCSENHLRSPTAEAVFSEYDSVEALSAGTNKDCECPVSGDLLEWADVVLVMEERHRRKVVRRFRNLLRGKKVGVLGIPDVFEFMDPLLVALLRARVPRYVRID